MKKQRVQIKGRRFGPKKKLKVIEAMGRDAQRHVLVKVHCDIDNEDVVMRWSDLVRSESLSKRGKRRRANASCGCGKRKAFKAILELKIDRVPREKHVLVWAAAQFATSIQNVARRFRIDKYTASEIVRRIHDDIQELDGAAKENGWWANCLALREELEEHRWERGRWKGEFTNKEMKGRKDRLVGSLAASIQQAREILERFSHLLTTQPEAKMALEKVDPEILEMLDAVKWLIETARVTQSNRDRRRKAWRARNLKQAGKALPANKALAAAAD